jgi:hypothetical protein
MRRVQVKVRRARPPDPVPEPDLRSPSGRPLPY